VYSLQRVSATPQTGPASLAGWEIFFVQPLTGRGSESFFHLIFDDNLPAKTAQAIRIIGKARKPSSLRALVGWVTSLVCEQSAAAAFRSRTRRTSGESAAADAMGKIFAAISYVCLLHDLQMRTGRWDWFSGYDTFGNDVPWDVDANYGSQLGWYGKPSDRIIAQIEQSPAGARLRAEIAALIERLKPPPTGDEILTEMLAELKALRKQAKPSEPVVPPSAQPPQPPAEAASPAMPPKKPPAEAVMAMTEKPVDPPAPQIKPTAEESMSAAETAPAESQQDAAEAAPLAADAGAEPPAAGYFGTVDAFIANILDKKSIRIKRKHISLVTGYKSRTEFQQFQRGQASQAVTESFLRTLALSPDEFLERLQKKMSQ